MNTRRIWTACGQVPVVAALLLAATSCSAKPATFDSRDPRSPLQLVRTIPLPEVHGRIDHMALDPQTNHLFVAELGNGSVDDVDLTSGMVAGRISGLHEPQGVAWLAAEQEIAVACGDGSVHFYRRSDRQEIARLSIGDDADNVRVAGPNLVVGVGSGALAVIEPSTHRVVRQLRLPGHPEAFAVAGPRVFVNVPDAREIIVGDLDRSEVVQTLGTGTKLGNYPMVVDAGASSVAIAFRFPASLAVIEAESGQPLFSAATCGDADDLYFHAGQIIVVCGEGAVELVDDSGAHGRVRITTQHGARTGLLDDARNRLFVAVPAGKGGAAIWELAFHASGLSQGR